MRTVYDPSKDPMMRKPYTDQIEKRLRNGISYTYIHGGFRGTDIKFSLYFPESDAYEGRFFQYIPPAANHEDASQKLTGGDDKITFSLTHGAYFVESNLGTLNPFSGNNDKTMPYRASAAVAEYSRKLARNIYGKKISRPYGYVFGGSGGAYKVMDCAESTDCWDGAVPYVNGAPVSVPHNLTIRAHSMRILRHKLNGIMEALAPDGDGDIYKNLNHIESEALHDLLSFGFPKGAIRGLGFLKDGSLPLLISGIKSRDPGYFEDFWVKPGYAGSDSASDAHEARLYHKTTVKSKFVPQKGNARAEANTTGVDTNWQRYKGMSGALGIPLIEVESMPENDFYEMGCFLYPKTGKAAGRKVYFNEHTGNTLAVAEHFGCDDMMEVMALLEPGDEVLLDNSDYIAASDYHLHALPKEPYAGYASCYHPDGTPKYVQRDVIANFTGSNVQTGDFSCKMIIEHTFCDESAFPYQGDWYKQLAYRVQGAAAQNRLRLMFMDNALHDDRADPVGVELDYVTNCASVYACLLYLVDWVEKGIEPPLESQYTCNGGELTFPEEAQKRGGIQNICRLTSKGKRHIQAKTGDAVKFDVTVDIPPHCGALTNVEWSFEGEKDFPIKTGKETCAEHVFRKPGKYTVVVRTYNERNGDDQTPFTQIRNIDKMVVTVE